MHEDWIKPTMLYLRLIVARRRLLVAILLAFCLVLLFPGTSEAHSVLVRSDPAPGSVLSVPPEQVSLWFSEALNPAFSTVVVVNSRSQRVNTTDAQIPPENTSEMDVALRPNLPPGVYTVVWRSDSNDDGHVLSASFFFTVANADGTVPTLSPGANPGANVLGSSIPIGLYTGQLDAPTFFNLVMITLVELAAVFWVGAQFWVIYVLRPSAEDHAELSASNQQIQQRFERRFSLLLLLILLLANAGVLLGQALNITGGNAATAFSLPLLGQLITSGRFGAYWLMRMVVLVLAVRLALYRLQLYRSQRAKSSRLVNNVLPWANLILGLALFIAIAMSSHAAAVSTHVVLFAIIADWLHLVAAALWVGGMMYTAASYLPILRTSSITEQAFSLITLLPYYTPWAITGVVIMAVTGPFSAAVQLSSWQQLLTTAYGRALVVKILLVGALLLTSAVHVLLLRPRLKKAYQKHAYVAGRLQAHPETTRALNPAVLFAGQVELSEEQPTYVTNHPLQIQPPSSHAALESGRTVAVLAQQVKRREGRLVKQTRRLTAILRWEPVVGVAVLVCVGLMNVFAGTLSPIAAAQQQQPTTGTTSSFHSVAQTTDKAFNVALDVTPNSAGPNRFIVDVADTHTGAPVTNVSIIISLSDTDMDMGIETAAMNPDKQGHFSAISNLLMGGNWQIRIQIRTPDNKRHEAVFKIVAHY